MLKSWIQKLFKKKNKVKKYTATSATSNTCDTCVYWASEEENNKPPSGVAKIKFCDLHKKYTNCRHTCLAYLEEKFEPHEGSVTTEELNLDLETSITEVRNEDDENDTKR